MVRNIKIKKKEGKERKKERKKEKIKKEKRKKIHLNGSSTRLYQNFRVSKAEII